METKTEQDMDDPPRFTAQANLQSHHDLRAPARKIEFVFSKKPYMNSFRSHIWPRRHLAKNLFTNIEFSTFL
jgi:hypothetical protein